MSEEKAVVVKEETKAVAPWAAVERALAYNDYSKLDDEGRALLLNKTCESMGLNPLGQPFGLIPLNGKLTLYAKRSCTDQLASIHGLSTEEVTEAWNDKTRIFTVKVKMRDKNGRLGQNRGDVWIAPNLGGQELANAFMKCHTKAIRRCVLAMCGLGFMDETEVEDSKPQPKVETVEKSIRFASLKERQSMKESLDRATAIPGFQEFFDAEFSSLDMSAITSVDCQRVIDFCDAFEKENGK
jgi:hypothetical protein